MEVKEMRTPVDYLLAAITMIFIIFLVSAGYATQPHAVVVQDYEKTVIKRTPYNVEVCSERKVSGDRTADAVMGAIIGGIIGNNVTKDLPDGGKAGAIIGGLLGHQNSTAKDGTQLVCNKLTRYKESMETIYSHSIITFNYDGKSYSVRFKK